MESHCSVHDLVDDKLVSESTPTHTTAIPEPSAHTQLTIKPPKAFHPSPAMSDQPEVRVTHFRPKVFGVTLFRASQVSPFTRGEWLSPGRNLVSVHCCTSVFTGSPSPADSLPCLLFSPRIPPTQWRLIPAMQFTPWPDSTPISATPRLCPDLIGWFLFFLFWTCFVLPCFVS